jgi:hypothetical protein
MAKKMFVARGIVFNVSDARRGRGAHFIFENADRNYPAVKIGHYNRA